MKNIKLTGLIFFLALLAACGGINNKVEEPLFHGDSSHRELAGNETGKYGAWGVDLTTQDSDIAPGDDFYGYANGAWLNSYVLPADKVKFGMLGLLREESRQNVKEIILSLNDAVYPPGSVERQIGDLYASYMNMDNRNKVGLQPIEDSLQAIQNLQTHAQVYEMFARSDIYRTGSVVSLYSTIDRKFPDNKAIAGWADGTGLPDRDYYLLDSPRFKEIRQAYKKHIQTMLKFGGYDAERASAAADQLLALETRIAQVLPTRVEARDASRNYNAYTYSEIVAYVPGLDFEAFIAASGIDTGVARQQKWLLRVPESFRKIVNLVNETPVATWRDYMAFNVVQGHSGYLHEELEMAAFEFNKVLSGQQQISNRWKRGVGLVSFLFGEAVGEVYIKHHFSEKSKSAMKVMITNLTEALRSRVENLDWMGDTTRVQALAKLNSFNTDKIAYPDKWEDYSGLTVSEHDLYANLISARTWRRNKRLKEMEEPIDRTKWGMTPQTVNAYYNPIFNEIVFPAAILQAPLFDLSADDAVNYGGIGAIIGHEMSHGFDNNGRRYDAHGVLRDWWSEQDSQAFTARAGVLVEQFNEYWVAEDVFVNGQFTLSENIGDLGGVMIAHEAYRRSLKGKEAPVIDGYSGDQRFFMSWAQAWREKVREEKAVQLSKSDPHSPGMYRVNGILRNIDAWYDAFNVTEDNHLYLPPEQRVRIW